VRAQRAVADVASLPTVTFGPRSLMWWGTVGFMIIESWTLALLVASYLYLRQNYTTWPPLRTPLPSLLVPTINLALMYLSFIPAKRAADAGHRLDKNGVRRWLTVLAVASVAVVVIRWWELWALNTRWDTNAYASAAWTIVGFHTSLILLDAVDTIGLALFFWFKPLPVKSFSDVADNSFYWYGTVAVWTVIYLVLYVGPRFF
jgi:heme/copper-type cytochrome/quinol oxidase subunit 3